MPDPCISYKPIEATQAQKTAWGQTRTDNATAIAGMNGAKVDTDYVVNGKIVKGAELGDLYKDAQAKGYEGSFQDFTKLFLEFRCNHKNGGQFTVNIDGVATPITEKQAQAAWLFENETISLNNVFGKSDDLDCTMLPITKPTQVVQSQTDANRFVHLTGTSAAIAKQPAAKDDESCYAGREVFDGLAQSWNASVNLSVAKKMEQLEQAKTKAEEKAGKDGGGISATERTAIDKQYNAYKAKIEAAQKEQAEPGGPTDVYAGATPNIDQFKALEKDVDHPATDNPADEYRAEGTYTDPGVVQTAANFNRLANERDKEEKYEIKVSGKQIRKVKHDVKNAEKDLNNKLGELRKAAKNHDLYTGTDKAEIDNLQKEIDAMRTGGVGVGRLKIGQKVNVTQEQVDALYAKYEALNERLFPHDE